MKILSRLTQGEICESLARIYHLAVRGMRMETREECLDAQRVIEEVAEIAYHVGGMHMMEIDVPARAKELQEEEDD